jgi:hypothetical protein
LNPYKNLILVLGLSILGFFAVAQGVRWVTFSPSPFERGRQLTQFSKEQLKLARREAISLGGLTNPFARSATAGKDFPPVSLSEVTEPASPPTGSRVSMILLQEGRKMAVVDNQVVKEGDSVNRSRVLRIEKDRILLRTGNGGDKWAAVGQDRAKEPGGPQKEKTVVAQATGKAQTEDKGTSK